MAEVTAFEVPQPESFGRVKTEDTEVLLQDSPTDSKLSLRQLQASHIDNEIRN